jgi:hypothetical protein
MFEVGDRVVCIDRGVSPILKEGKVYTIGMLSIFKHNVILTIDHVEYGADRFISIEENRRRKLNKIISKIND